MAVSFIDERNQSTDNKKMALGLRAMGKYTRNFVESGVNYHNPVILSLDKSFSWIIEAKNIICYHNC